MIFIRHYELRSVVCTRRADGLFIIIYTYIFFISNLKGVDDMVYRVERARSRAALLGWRTCCRLRSRRSGCRCRPRQLGSSTRRRSAILAGRAVRRKRSSASASQAMPAMAADSEAQPKEVTMVTASATLTTLLAVVSSGGRLEHRLFSLAAPRAPPARPLSSGPALCSSP